MPLPATVTVSNRIKALQRDLTILSGGLARVLQANGPYYDMRPWRLVYLRFLLTQATNLQINVNQLSGIVFAMLSQTEGLTKKYLLAQQAQVISISHRSQQIHSQIKERIERDKTSLQKRG